MENLLILPKIIYLDLFPKLAFIEDNYIEDIRKMIILLHLLSQKKKSEELSY